MGNCTVKDEEGNEISSGILVLFSETITKSCFNFLYVIGRGGFGKVIFFYIFRSGKLKKRVLKNSMQLKKSVK